MPAGQPRGVIVYYHGGGWVIGGLDDFDKLGRLLAQRTGCAVLLVDYRLAPEYRFPVAVDDSWAALRWADEHRAELAGRAGVPLIVAGDSAGGNLSAVMAQRARAAGGPGDRAAGARLPGDRLRPGDDLLPRPGQPAACSPGTRWSGSGTTTRPTPRPALHPDASPLRSATWPDLPPAVVLTAEHDLLRDEGELYATRLLKAGVPVRHRRFEGQMHGFFTMVDVLPGADDGLDYVAAAIDEQLAGAGASEPAARSAIRRGRRTARRRTRCLPGRRR